MGGAPRWRMEEDEPRMWKHHRRFTLHHVLLVLYGGGVKVKVFKSSQPIMIQEKKKEVNQYTT